MEGTGAAVLVAFRSVVRALLRSMGRMADGKEVPGVLRHLGQPRDETPDHQQDESACRHHSHGRQCTRILPTLAQAPIPHFRREPASCGPASRLIASSGEVHGSHGSERSLVAPAHHAFLALK